MENEKKYQKNDEHYSCPKCQVRYWIWSKVWQFDLDQDEAIRKKHGDGFSAWWSFIMINNGKRAIERFKELYIDNETCPICEEWLKNHA